MEHVKKQDRILFVTTNEISLLDIPRVLDELGYDVYEADFGLVAQSYEEQNCSKIKAAIKEVCIKYVIHIADKQVSIVVECMRDGMHIHEDTVGVLTNNPPFDFHMHNLCQYMNLTALWPENHLVPEVKLHPFGRGMGAIGLPGDASPASRFVRAAFLLHNSVCDEEHRVAHFFHLLDSVAMTRGSVIAPGDKWEATLYSCCMDAEAGIYYYKTYTNNQLTAVHLHNANLDGEALVEFPLEMKQHIAYAN